MRGILGHQPPHVVGEEGGVLLLFLGWAVDGEILKEKANTEDHAPFSTATNLCARLQGFNQRVLLLSDNTGSLVVLTGTFILLQRDNQGSLKEAQDESRFQG